MTYKEQIKHPYWQKKRLEILQRDGWKCISCKNEVNNLQVHHLYYTSGAMIWEYDDEALVTICEKCHEHYHDYMQKSIALISLTCFLSGISLIDLDEYLKFCIDYKKGLI